MASVGANAVLKVTMDSKDFDQGMHRAQKRTKDFENQTKKAQGQLRLMRGGLGQLGHQVQDVAVQLQAGQNAMLVFGQQGSQIASLMGPNGALIGAVLAVGAAIATALLPTLFGMGEGMNKKLMG
jgi:phage-related tail fiber protein